MAKWVFDSEVYRNFYMVAFLSSKGEVKSFRTPFSRNDRESILNILENDTIIGFNSLNYDLPLLNLAISGKCSESKIKDRSDRIINNNIKWWQNDSGLPYCKDHIDLIEVAFGKASLKIYGGRLGADRMQSLPINHDKVLTEDEKDLIEKYCINDLKVTALLAKSLTSQLNIRREMGKQYNTDLMSKSDAQIAEAVLKSELESYSKRSIEPGYTFKYKPPAWLKFRTPELKDVLETVRNVDFVVKDTGKVTLPKEISIVEVFGKKYKMGIGGLHSTEKKTYTLTTESVIVSDHDVASYYPSIILNEKLYPEHLGGQFLNVYKGIVERRLEAKAKGDETTANTLKIVINGSFGKFGSKYSILFAPELLIQVTLTGQLALLMLIEAFEHFKIPVVSANTDGIVLACPADRVGLRDKIIKAWEDKTGFTTEATFYQALYSRDVNNYLAVKMDGSYKGKGIFTPPSMGKNSQYPIVYKAVALFLSKAVPLEETIRSCTDPKLFCSIRTVKGGAVDQQGNELGTAIRWYYSTESHGAITYALNGNKVAETDNAKPMMQLTDNVPADLDHEWYVSKAKEVLSSVGIG